METVEIPVQAENPLKIPEKLLTDAETSFVDLTGTETEIPAYFSNKKTAEVNPEGFDVFYPTFLTFRKLLSQLAGGRDFREAMRDEGTKQELLDKYSQLAQQAVEGNPATRAENRAVWLDDLEQQVTDHFLAEAQASAGSEAAAVWKAFLENFQPSTEISDQELAGIAANLLGKDEAEGGISWGKLPTEIQERFRQTKGYETLAREGQQREAGELLDEEVETTADEQGQETATEAGKTKLEETKAKLVDWLMKQANLSGLSEEERQNLVVELQGLQINELTGKAIAVLTEKLDLVPANIWDVKKVILSSLFQKWIGGQLRKNPQEMSEDQWVQAAEQFLGKVDKIGTTQRTITKAEKVINFPLKATDKFTSWCKLFTTVFLQHILPEEGRR